MTERKCCAERTSPVSAAAESQPVATLDEAHRMIAQLRDCNQSQHRLLAAWKQKLRDQREMMFRLHREREEQMRLLTSQLLLLEANLRAKQSKIDGLLNQRDRVIANQQETIRKLERQLERCRCSDVVHPDRPRSLDTASVRQDRQCQKVALSSSSPPPPSVPSPVAVRILGHEQGDESLDDSDSAVVIEDDHHTHSPTFAQSTQVKVIRSISDVVESSLYRETQGILKTSKLVRNYYQRRVMFRQEPEVREASPEPFHDDGVDEEDEDRNPDDDEDDDDDDNGSSGSDDSPFNKRGHKTFLRGSFERMPVDAGRGPGGARAHCTNHRSVIRPRDVKHKKNNKCSASWKPAGDGCTSTLDVPSRCREFQRSFPHAV